MNIYRILLIIVSLTVVTNSIIKFIMRQSGQSVFKVLSALVIWIPILFISFNPSYAYVMSKKLGFGDNLNTLIFMGFIAVFMIIFKLISIIEKLEQNITEIIRKEALKDLLSK